jgi:hypothetical protein
VPDQRSHRGADPRDSEAFGPAALPGICQAVADLSWLLGRGYAIVSAVKLVGDRYELSSRQRLAVRRAACSDFVRDQRRSRQVGASELSGQPLFIDGFNVLTSVETALGGGVVLWCRDGTFRDVAGVHGTYRKVGETIPALNLIGQVVARLDALRVFWIFDRPVSNSGRIREILLERSAEKGWNWAVELSNNPDAQLRASQAIVATADSAILDRCERWFNLARFVIETACPDARIIDLESARAVDPERANLDS